MLKTNKQENCDDQFYRVYVFLSLFLSQYLGSVSIHFKMPIKSSIKLEWLCSLRVFEKCLKMVVIRAGHGVNH